MSMLSILKNLILKRPALKTAVPTVKLTPEDKDIQQFYIDDNIDMRPVLNEMAKVEDMLKVKVSELHYVPYIANIEHEVKLIMDPDEEGLAVDSTDFILGHYLNGKILLGSYNPATRKPFNEAERMLIALHELRHRWQEQYEYEKYYTTNAVGQETINDISEIDADAFAMAYMDACTKYQNELYMQIMKGYMQLDNGKRAQRKKAIETMYFKKN